MVVFIPVKNICWFVRVCGFDILVKPYCKTGPAFIVYEFDRRTGNERPDWVEKFNGLN
jgi:hypothetical protein